MVKFKTIGGYAVVILLSVGVVATILAVLMTSGDGSQSESEVADTLPQGDYIYTEVEQLGSIRGKISEAEGIIMFRGIPYGEPPVGKLRWQKPRPVSGLKYNGMYYDATYHRAGCPQNCSLPSPQYSCPDKMSEDCLHLAVYVPSRLAKKIETNEGYYYSFQDSLSNSNLPVMVFFHGGAFIGGGNGVPLYDGRYISEIGDVIVVVPNYRLGPFGFFFQDTGDLDAALGNYGIWDQIEALVWVKNHIRKFGGNSDQVTIFGQSAGAQSVAVHLVNTVSAPLFHKAIMESNPFGLNYKTKEEAQTLGANFAKSADCSENDLECLRGLTMEEVIATLNDFSLLYQFNPNSITQLFEPWAPVIDENLLYEHPYLTFLEKRNQDKPMVFGTTKDEGMFFVLEIFNEKSTSTQLYKFLIELIFGSSADKVVSLYPPSCANLTSAVDCDNRYEMDDWITDYLFTCPSRHVFTNTVSGEISDIWWYTFNQTWSFPEFWEEYDACYDLVCHAAELPYLFNMDDVVNDPSIHFTNSESQLSLDLIHYWTNFARHGNPNGNGGDESWPRMLQEFYSKGSFITLQINAENPHIVHNFNQEKCDMFDSIDMYLDDSIKISPKGYKEILKIVQKLETEI